MRRGERGSYTRRARLCVVRVKWWTTNERTNEEKKNKTHSFVESEYYWLLSVDLSALKKNTHQHSTQNTHQQRECTKKKWTIFIIFVCFFFFNSLCMVRYRCKRRCVLLHSLCVTYFRVCCMATGAFLLYAYDFRFVYECSCLLDPSKCKQ